MALKMKNSQHTSTELNFIGAGTFLEGTIESNGSIRVDGKVKGTIKSGDTLTIGSSGEITGEVYARNAVLGGKINGNVNIEEKLILEATSSLNGNLRAGKLIIDEGAVFNGKSEMGKNFNNDKNFSGKVSAEIGETVISGESPNAPPKK